MMKFIAIAGSAAEKSYNRTLLEFMQKHFVNKAEIEILDLRQVPIFVETEEQDDLPIIQTFNEKISAADGVILATPEHNHSIPSALKNIIEHLSFNLHPLDGKPIMLVGASYDIQGSSRAQLHLRQILDTPGVNAIVMPGHEFLLGRAHEAFDEDGNLKDENTVHFLETCFGQFLRFTDVASILSLPEEVRFEPGHYEVKAVGHNGPLPITVSFSDTRIDRIDIDSGGETDGIADLVFTRIPEQIIENQTLNVDAVSGASVTSQSVLDGVADAVRLAGADPNILKKRPKIATKSATETIEYDTDILVIGGGGAGLAAAAATVQAGKEVILLEKFPSLGGNTVRAGGPMNAAEPEWQATFSANPGEAHTLEEIAAIDEDTIDSEYLEDFISLRAQINDYLERTQQGEDYLFDSVLLHRIQTYLGGKREDLNGQVIYGDYKLVKQLTDNALGSVEWLTEIGVPFERDDVSMPVGALWRRGHKPEGNEGFAFISVLKPYVEENGGLILTETPAKELLVEDGKITGVIGQNAKGDKVIVHAKATIITSGGFGANTKMLQKYNTYWTEIADDIKTSNSPAITGDGILLGESVGADLVGMGFSQLMPTSDPETGGLFSGLQVPPANFVMVDTEGKRFVNEFGSRDELAQAAINVGGLFYLIADDLIKETAYNTSQEKIDQQVAAGTLFRDDTIEGLAEQLGMDPAVLADTIAKYNSYVDAGEDPEFHKSAFALKVVQAPFYATPRKPAVHHTMGGLKIDTEARVINTDGQVIPGLFAAGEVAGGIHAGNRLGGNALTDIFTFGRIAAITALAEMDEE